MTENNSDKKKAFVKVMLLLGIGFVIDVGQTLIVYNAGKSVEAKKLGSTHKWTFPVGKELVSTLVLVAVSSVLTGLIVSAAEVAILGPENKSKEPEKQLAKA